MCIEIFIFAQFNGGFWSRLLHTRRLGIAIDCSVWRRYVCFKVIIVSFLIQYFSQDFEITLYIRRVWYLKLRAAFS